MTTFADDLITLLTAAGIGTAGATLFATSKAVIPTGAGPYLSIRETGGSGPEFTHNEAMPAMYKPAAQLVARAGDDFDRVIVGAYAAAEDMARRAYDALVVVGNVTVGTTYYLSLTPMQEPFDLGPDNIGRAQVAFNVMAVRRPS